MYSVLCSNGVRIFGTNLHRLEKFGLLRQRHLLHRLWKRGTHQKSSLRRKLRAFCGLHLIAKWSCFIYVISDLFCRMSIFYFCIFLKKLLWFWFKKSNAVMAQWRKKVTWHKRRENWELHSKSVSACFHISNRPLPFHLHLHEISKFLDSET